LRRVNGFRFRVYAGECFEIKPSLGNFVNIHFAANSAMAICANPICGPYAISAIFTSGWLRRDKIERHVFLSAMRAFREKSHG
jgi:hypothetical protein